MLRPAHRFRVYPNIGTPWRYEVCVFSSLEKMYKYARQKWDLTSTNYLAICLSFGTAEIKGRLLGEILFTVRGLTHGLVCHESIHGSTHWMQTRCGKDAVVINSSGEGHETEELIAYATMSMVKQITQELSKREITIA